MMMRKMMVTMRIRMPLMSTMKVMTMAMEVKMNGVKKKKMKIKSHMLMRKDGFTLMKIPSMPLKRC